MHMAARPRHDAGFPWSWLLPSHRPSGLPMWPFAWSRPACIRAPLAASESKPGRTFASSLLPHTLVTADCPMCTSSSRGRTASQHTSGCSATHGACLTFPTTLSAPSSPKRESLASAAVAGTRTTCVSLFKQAGMPSCLQDGSRAILTSLNDCSWGRPCTILTEAGSTGAGMEFERKATWTIRHGQRKRRVPIRSKAWSAHKLGQLTAVSVVAKAGARIGHRRYRHTYR